MASYAVYTGIVKWSRHRATKIVANDDPQFCALSQDCVVQQRFLWLRKGESLHEENGVLRNCG
jgi:hypothetical protein